MRWGIFCDIHANLEALQAVLAAFSKERIDRYLCLGDVVGYGANPNECITEVKKLNPVIIAGNHDWGTADLFDITYFNAHAQAAILWTSKNINYENKQFLKNLELVYQKGDITSVHGSLTHPEQFEYILDISSAEETFQLLQTKVCFVGHTHVSIIFIKRGKHYTATSQTEIVLESSQSYIVNAGSVGQPRDGNPKSSYVVYDSESNQLQIKRAPYDIQKTRDKIIKAGLPRILAERLTIGR
ncbi:MAG: metallophosphatase family protein [Omnitrophica bacterium]|nr:metallophosphatase family protein [Candidatus Omnitrophota bacterium]